MAEKRPFLTSPAILLDCHLACSVTLLQKTLLLLLSKLHRHFHSCPLKASLSLSPALSYTLFLHLFLLLSEEMASAPHSHMPPAAILMRSRAAPGSGFMMQHFTQCLFLAFSTLKATTNNPPSSHSEISRLLLLLWLLGGLGTGLAD